MKNHSKIWLLTAILLLAAMPTWAAVNESFTGYQQTSYGNYDYNGFHLNNCLVDSVTSVMGGNYLPSNAVRVRNAAGSYLEYVGSDGNGKDGGVGTISFQWRAWDNTPATVDDVLVSVNGGAYSMIGQINSTTYTPYQAWSYDLNNTSDNIKVKIYNVTGERLHVDDVSITDYAGGGDVTPPAITTIDVISHTTIDVHFTETVTVASAQITANYTVDNAVGHPLSATRTDTATVRLVFNTLAGNTYQLTADSVRDATGNGSHSTATFVIDATPPSITSIGVTSTSTLDVHFSESVDVTTSQVTTNYSVNNGVGNPLTATRDGANFSVVHLTFNTMANNSYTLTANGVQDLLGNACVNATGVFSIGVMSMPGDIVINEIMYDDTASQDSEWVELHNTTGAIVNVGGWILTDAATYPVTGTEGAIQIPQGTSIPANGYLVVSRNQLPGITGYVQCTQYFGTWALGNTGDNLALYTDSVGGTLIDGSLSVNFPDLAGANLGYSIEKCNENNTWADTTWHTSTNNFAAAGRYRRCTPGAANTICVVDNVPPTLVSASMVSSTILEVTFSEDVSQATAEAAANYSVNNGIGAPASAARQTNFAVVRLTFASALPTNSYLLTVNNVQDLANNTIAANSQIAFSVSAPAPQLIFTEIMPNPNFAGTADSLGEWFEVYNPNASAINMNGWIITDGAGSDTIVGDVLINSGQYFVFCSNGDSAGNGGVPENYAYHFATSGTGISLSNSGDSIAIMNAGGQLSAGVRYTVNFGFSEGHSCQIRDLANPMSDETNWCRCDSIWAGATQTDHGTPGRSTICAPVLPVQYYTICDIRDEDACGTPSLLDRRVITQGVVTYTDSCRKNAYIEFNGCGVMIYGHVVGDTMQNIGRRMAIGDLVEVNGYIKQFRALTEIDSMFGVLPTITLLSSGHPIPAPVQISAADIKASLTTCTAENLESRFVRLLDMTFVRAATDTYFVANTNYYAFNGTDTVLFRVNICDVLVGDTIPTVPVPITAILGQFNASTTCHCGGYQLVTGNATPFAPVVCAQPVGLTVYRDTPNNTVTLRWQAGVNQTCNCYEVYWAADATSVFPTGYTLLSTVVGSTQYTDTDALSTRRFYLVRAGGSSCP